MKLAGASGTYFLGLEEAIFGARGVNDSKTCPKRLPKLKKSKEKKDRKEKKREI